MCPRISTSVDSVFWAMSMTRALVSLPARAVFKNLALTILFLSSCFLISLRFRSVTPALPMRTVGLAVASWFLTYHFFPGVISGI